MALGLKGDDGMKMVYSAELKLIDLVYDAIMILMGALEGARKKVERKWRRS